MPRCSTEASVHIELSGPIRQLLLVLATVQPSPEISQDIVQANARLSPHDAQEPLRKRNVSLGFLYSEIPNLPVLVWFSCSCRETAK
jgi:hypothetical protein